MMNVTTIGNSEDKPLKPPSSLVDSDESIVTINIGGQVFQTCRGTLRKRAVGRLSRLTETDEHYSKQIGQYFFDRESAFFEEVLRFYRTGVLHIPSGACANVMRNELDFWQLTDDVIGDCCWREYRHKLERYEVDVKLNKQCADLRLNVASPNSYALRRFIWRFLEHPTSSRAAKVWMSFSILLTLTSIICHATLTVSRGKMFFTTSMPSNGTDLDSYLDSRRFVVNIIIIDAICMVVFSLDLMLKIYSAPSRRSFICSILFVCDLLHVIPGLMIDISILGRFLPVVDARLRLIFLQVSTLNRIFKIIRLACHSTGVRLLSHALLASLRELFLLLVFVMIGTMMFGFLFYSVEISSSDKLENAFQGCWWAVITMSTVGYGDFYPESSPGYVIAALCALSGLILVGMPIPIIANNFQLYSGFRERLIFKRTASPISKVTKVCEEANLFDGKYTYANEQSDLSEGKYTCANDKSDLSEGKYTYANDKSDLSEGKYTYTCKMTKNRIDLRNGTVHMDTETIANTGMPGSK